MVTGIDRFRLHFEDYEDQYVLIGGAACDLIMSEVGLDFRATKDLDIVLIVEALDPAFAEHFWAFVEAGGYEIRQNSEGKQILYRFQKPRENDFPAMLELFSRIPEGLALAADNQMTPLPIDEAAASLSAILLDPDYYDFLKTMTRTLDGITVLDEAAIIPFKARAWIDLSRRRDGGEQVGSKNVTKHRNDVARLLQLLSPEARITLPSAIATDMAAFADAVSSDTDFDPNSFDVAMTRNTVSERLRKAYQL